MFTQTVFLRIPADTTERVLHQGKVLEATPDNLVAEFVDPLGLAPGADVTLYAEVRGKFFQQGATIVAVQQETPFPILAFKKVGQPSSAESRGSFRVSSAATQILASIAGQLKCPIVDISPEGFAAITRCELPLGASVQIAFEFEGVSCSGPARVQTLRTLPNGTRRYGFLAVDAATMRATLGQITANVQRSQLRRLSRTA